MSGAILRSSDILKSRGSSFGIETRLQTGRSGFKCSVPDGGWEFFFSSPRPKRIWGPPSLLSSEVLSALSLGVKGPWCEASI
jgi:hypothetical protein